MPALSARIIRQRRSIVYFSKIGKATRRPGNRVRVAVALGRGPGVRVAVEVGIAVGVDVDVGVGVGVAAARWPAS